MSSPSRSAPEPAPAAERLPFRVDRLPVGDGHVLQVTHWGTPGAPLALVLHGGPGSGSSPVLRRGFDPARWHVVMVDQRGAGGSTPAGALGANTTAHLLDDLHRVHETLDAGVGPAAAPVAGDRAHPADAPAPVRSRRAALVVGGSWGGTLALRWAAAAPSRVLGLLLRNPFLARPDDVAAFFSPASGLPPALWADFCDAAGVPEACDVATLLTALAARLRAGPAPQAERLALAWWRWEAARSGQDPNAWAPPDAARRAVLVGRYRVQSHYLAHGCWMPPQGLLGVAAALPATLPVHVVQGAADAVCPPAGARALRAAMPWATGVELPGAGHDPTHPAIAAAMREALAHWAAHGCFVPAPAPVSSGPGPTGGAR